jgi:hypothetical protein
VRAAALLAILATAGCTPVVELGQHYRESEYAWASAPGTASLFGQAFAKTMAGDVKYCAGEPVQLWPKGTYTDRAYDALLDKVYVRDSMPEGLKKYIRSTTGDGFGAFEFSNLPAGSYYVTCNVQWSYATGVSVQRTGGVAIAPVTVAAGERKKVIVTLPTR